MPAVRAVTVLVPSHSFAIRPHTHTHNFLPLYLVLILDGSQQQRVDACLYFIYTDGCDGVVATIDTQHTAHTCNAVKWMRDGHSVCVCVFVYTFWYAYACVGYTKLDVSPNKI